jgi:GLPGLI family protein
MKKIIYLILIIPFFGFSQSYKIEYQIKLNHSERNGFLTLNENKTPFYYEVSNKGETKRKKSKQDGNYQYTITLGSKTNNKRYQIYYKQKDTLLNIDYISNEKVLCYEKFPNMKWKIHDNTKTISSYICTKAETTFRGRKYIAWFTSEIPIRFGPWKFNNLPGLIIQVYDETQLFTWNATKIDFTENSEKFISIDKDLIKISLKEFVKRDEEIKKRRGSQLLLKYLERGAEVSGHKHNRGRELKFEWEKEKKKQ